MSTAVALFTLFVSTWLFAAFGRAALQWAQHSSYRPERFWRRVFSFPDGILFSQRYALVSALVLALVAFALLAGAGSNLQKASLLVLLLILSVASFKITLGVRSEKKPFVFTGRSTRLAFAGAALVVLFGGALFYSFSFSSASALFAGGAALSPLFILVAVILMKPLEDQINGYYLRDAKKKRQALNDLLVIGITGSYGKTSTKHVIQEIVSQKFLSYMSPGSVNTDLGLARLIREEIRPIHQVFVAEMGARHVGDIDSCSAVAQPTWGVLTVIGKAHLEMFGSQENIAKGKSELIESLPANGRCFLNGDDPFTEQIRHKAKCPVILFAVDNPEADYSASDITVSERGSTFTLSGKAVAEPVPFTTHLLGKHNIRNIVSALAVGHQLEIEWSRMQQAVRAMAPVQHRLQLIDRGNGILVIDDSFNSNPSGFQEALQVLSNFSGRRRILVTPGMIELGEREFELNEEVAKLAANSCDYVVLVGNEHRVKPLLSGLQKESFPSEKVRVVSSLKEAQSHLQQLNVPGDVVLFENDLPDIYG